MQRLSYLTGTVLSNKITSNRIVLPIIQRQSQKSIRTVTFYETMAYSSNCVMPSDNFCITNEGERKIGSRVTFVLSLSRPNVGRGGGGSNFGLGGRGRGQQSISEIRFASSLRSQLVSVFIVGLSYGAKNVLSFTRCMMQNFLQHSETSY